MATKAGSLGNIYRRFKPQLLMVLAQIGYTFLYFITEASFNHGMNPHVYITYRHIVAGVVMFPFAYFLERYVYIFPFYIISVRRWRAKCMLSVFKLVVKDWFYLWYINYMIYQNIIFESFLKNRMESGLTKSFAV